MRVTAVESTPLAKIGLEPASRMGRTADIWIVSVNHPHSGRLLAGIV
jgi:hypothetical protein